MLKETSNFSYFSENILIMKERFDLLKILLKNISWHFTICMYAQQLIKNFNGKPKGPKRKEVWDYKQQIL